LQFSIHSTDKHERDNLIPIKKWDLKKISDFGERFFSNGDRKITLNFAISDKYFINHKIINSTFNPDKFLIKLTPINPTISAKKNNINNGLYNNSLINENESVKALKKSGFEVLISIGELEENKIGSNCGQYIKKFMTEKNFIIQQIPQKLIFMR
jgi:23S rRNA (adenine2503-C2)-methyltransferase